MTNKLRACGIIVEYNPLHNGHIYHINQAKNVTQCDVLIAIMSPQFTQRGEPAFVDKWQRTQAALDAGVDIILELPTYYVLQSADYFAMAAIKLLQHLSIDDLVYGVESLNFDEKASFNEALMDQGASYALAMGQKGPNNILAQCYEKELEMTSIQGHRLQRTNDYNSLDIENIISSASAIRYAHHNKNDVSHTTPMVFKDYHILSEYEAFIHYALISQTPEQLKQYLLVDEGIEYLFKKHQNLPLNELIEACTSKRYTRSRIKRTLLNILLKHRKDTPASLDQVRILGFNQNGQEYLKHIKNDDVHYTPSFKNYINKDMELLATQIYALPKSQDIQNTLFQLELDQPLRK